METTRKLFNIYLSDEEKKAFSDIAKFSNISLSEWIRTVLIERVTNGSNFIDDEWIKIAKDRKQPIKVFLNEAVQSYISQYVPVKTVNNDQITELQQIIEEKNDEIDELEQYIQSLPQHFQSQELIHIGQENIDNWTYKLHHALIMAKGKWISLKKLDSMFKFRDTEDKEEYKEAIWKHLIKKKGVEYNHRFGFRVTEEYKTDMKNKE